VAVETEGAASFAAALAVGGPVTLPAITSVATSLGAKRVMQHAVDLTRQHDIISLTVTDAEALTACNRFVDTTRVLVEPACGAAIAALDVHRERLSRFEAPLVVVCGGTGVTLARLYAWSLELDLH